ncbi:hypothetical protein STAQ_01000 [Allostella sp. ATCC 35155]|nr:hypothetical protein STAQ_01000 [Stella sp. ATCC 35155]
MTSLLFLVPVALGLGAAGLAAFLWALRSGQFDDLDGEGARILFDEDRTPSRTGRPGAANPGEPACPPSPPSPSVP